MSLPGWPIETFAPQQSGFQPIQRSLDPIATDMEGGNARQRPRPGDNVGTIRQTIWMSMAEHDIFVNWEDDAQQRDRAFHHECLTRIELRQQGLPVRQAGHRAHLQLRVD